MLIIGGVFLTLISQNLPHALSEGLLYRDHLIMLGDISQGNLCIAEYEAKYINKGLLTQRAGHEARFNRFRTPFSELSSHRCEPHASFSCRISSHRNIWTAPITSGSVSGLRFLTRALDTVWMMNSEPHSGKRYVLKLVGLSIRWSIFANEGMEFIILILYLSSFSYIVEHLKGIHTSLPEDF